MRNRPEFIRRCFALETTVTLKLIMLAARKFRAAGRGSQELMPQRYAAIVRGEEGYDRSRILRAAPVRSTVGDRASGRTGARRAVFARDVGPSTGTRGPLAADHP
ncbi:hypothetical protein GCM10009764_09570 [Nocardia ninae]|uniref:Uncharacterized protein n=1 Tax=Nocardia ninae NBRC 108245 TaxID=1210091 RepID=A0A511MEV3_9NOCA|nr:hypothetical protein NN4_36280 [Nocardia ninae NBRC 108245]